MYRSLIDGWDRQKTQYVDQQRFELAAHAKEHRDLIHYALANLLQRLSGDSRFGRGVIPEEQPPDES